MSRPTMVFCSGWPAFHRARLRVRTTIWWCGLVAALASRQIFYSVLCSRTCSSAKSTIGSWQCTAELVMACCSRARAHPITYNCQLLATSRVLFGSCARTSAHCLQGGCWPFPKCSLAHGPWAACILNAHCLHADVFMARRQA